MLRFSVSDELRIGTPVQITPVAWMTLLISQVVACYKTTIQTV